MSYKIDLPFHKIQPRVRNKLKLHSASIQNKIEFCNSFRAAVEWIHNTYTVKLKYDIMYVEMMDPANGPNFSFLWGWHTWYVEGYCFHEISFAVT